MFFLAFSGMAKKSSLERQAERERGREREREREKERQLSFRGLKMSKNKAIFSKESNNKCKKNTNGATAGAPPLTPLEELTTLLQTPIQSVYGGCYA